MPDMFSALVSGLLFYTSCGKKMDDVEKAIEDFEKYMELERNFSPHTILSYRTDLRQFRQFIADFHLSVEREKKGKAMHVEPSIIRAFLSFPYKNNVRKTSISRKIATLRCFLKYLVREGKAECNPA